MAVPYTQLAASTYDAVVTNKPQDQWSDCSFLNAMEEMGGVKRVTPGLTPQGTLDYRANSAADFLATDTTATSTSKTDILTASSPVWSTLVVPYNWTFTDEVLNDGEAKVDLLDAQANSAITSHDFAIETACFAATGGTDGFQTLEDIFTEDGTGTQQGIVAGTETWWKNQFKDWGTDTGATLLADYNTLYYSCQKGSSGKQPNIVVANSTMYGSFVAANQANQRFLSADEARTGFKSIYLINAKYVFSAVPTTAQDSAWMFNTKDTFLVVAKNAFRKRRPAIDFVSAAMVNVKIFSVLQFMTVNRSRGGKLWT